MSPSLTLWPLAGSFVNLEQPCFPLFCFPSLHPCLHPLAGFGTPNIDGGDHTGDPQRATEHGQFPKGAVLAVRNTETGAFLIASTLRDEALDRKASLPGV